MANRLYNKQVSPKGYKAGGSVKEDPMRDRKKQPLKTKSGGKKTNPFDPNKDPKKRLGRKMGGSLKPVQPNQKGLSKLPTEVRNKMGYMKKGGVVSDTKKKQFKENKAGQKSFNKKAMKVAKTIGKIVIPAAGAADVGVKLAKKFKGAK